MKNLLKSPIAYFTTSKPFVDTTAFKYLWQRLTRGWDDSDTWNLNTEVLRFTLPRLKKFLELNTNYPTCILEDWNNIDYPSDPTPYDLWVKEISSMIYAMEALVKYSDSDEEVEFTEEEFEKVKDGMNSFHKYFHELWW